MELTVTQLLEDARRGDRSAEAAALEAVYGELHRLASCYMRRERPDHTLQASALVNEAYVHLLGGNPVSFESRAHFFVTAAQTMRRILVDHARARHAEKRGSGGVKVELNETLLVTEGREAEWLTLDDALSRLAVLDPRQARIVELRFFAGQTVEETAAILGISPKTVKRDWAVARAWLEGALRDVRS